MPSKLNLVVKLQHWIDTVPGQTFLNYAYSWGASVVILGALFKLTHLPGGNVMLFLGMGTEAFVFFLQAFDRPFDKNSVGKDLPDDFETDEEIERAESLASGRVAGGTVIIGGGAPVVGGTAVVGGGAAVVGGAPVVGGEGVEGQAAAFVGGAPVVGGTVIGGTPVVGGAPVVGGTPAVGEDIIEGEVGEGQAAAFVGGAPVVGGGAPVVGGGAVAGGTPVAGNTGASVDSAAVAALASAAVAAAESAVSTETPAAAVAEPVAVEIPAAEGEATEVDPLTAAAVSSIYDTPEGEATVEQEASKLASIIRLANDELLRRAQAVLSPEMDSATQEYIEKLQTLNETLAKVDEQSARLTRDSQEMENLNRTLIGINKVYDLHFASISRQVTTIEDINNQTKQLAAKIEEVNQIYTRMMQQLTIMTNPMGAAAAAPSTPTPSPAPSAL